MDKYLAIGGCFAGALFFALLGTLLWGISAARIGLAERALRMRRTGAFIAALALAWCVPQIQAVAWRAFVPWVWPSAAVALVLAYFYLDNLMARGVAGLFIMGAYTFVQLSFAEHLATGVIGAVMAWSWGIVGIMIAGKPCWLRDYLRCASGRPWLRRTVAVYAMLTAAVLVIAGFLLWKGGK